MGGRGAAGGGGGSSKGGGAATPKLQPLTGSEKQVKWANDIRDGALRALDHLESEYDRFKKMFGNDSSARETVGYEKDDVRALRATIVQFLNDPRASSASVVIDRRRDFTQEALTRMAHNHYLQRKRK